MDIIRIQALGLSMSGRGCISRPWRGGWHAIMQDFAMGSTIISTAALRPPSLEIHLVSGSWIGRLASRTAKMTVRRGSIRVLGIHGSSVAWQGVDQDVTAKIFHYAAM